MSNSVTNNLGKFMTSGTGIIGSPNPFTPKTNDGGFGRDPFGDSHPSSQKNYFHTFLTYVQIINSFIDTLYLIHSQTDPSKQKVLDVINTGINRFQRVADTLNEVIQQKLKNYSHPIFEDKMDYLKAVIDNLENEKRMIMTNIVNAKKQVPSGPRYINT